MLIAILILMVIVLITLMVGMVILMTVMIPRWQSSVLLEALTDILLL